MSNLTGPKEFAHHEQKKTKILTNIPGIAYFLLLSLWHHQFLSVKARDQQNQKISLCLCTPEHHWRQTCQMQLHTL